METANSAAARESRRRKIMERGADRLTLISSRIHTLPPLSSDSSHPSDSILPDPPPSDQVASPPADENEAIGSTSANDDATVDAGHGSTNAEAPVQSDSVHTEASRNSAFDMVSSMHPSPSLPSSAVQTSALSYLSPDGYLGTQTQRNRFFTPSQISSAIAASKRSRLFGSVVIAILVVLFHLGHPLIGSSILKSVTSFRPLYLVLVTDLTLVLARLLLNNKRGSERPKGAEPSIPTTGGHDWTEQAGKALEAGLAVQKAIDALVMDCSIYAIITICGISLVSKSAA